MKLLRIFFFEDGECMTIINFVLGIFRTKHSWPHNNVHNNILELILSHKYGLVHKIIVDLFCYFIIWLPGISEKEVLAQSVHP